MYHMVLTRSSILVISVQNHMLDFALFKDTCFFTTISKYSWTSL